MQHLGRDLVQPQIDLPLHPGTRVHVQVRHHGMARGHAEILVAEKHNGRVVGLGVSHHHQVVPVAPHEQALQLGLHAISPLGLAPRQILARRIHLMDVANDLLRRRLHASGQPIVDLELCRQVSSRTSHAPSPPPPKTSIRSPAGSTPIGRAHESGLYVEGRERPMAFRPPCYFNPAIFAFRAPTSTLRTVAGRLSQRVW